MALIADHIRTARDLLPGGEDSAADAGPGDRMALKCRPAPSRRVPQTTMPYHVCLRLAGAWFAGLTVVLALVLTIRWFA